MNNTTNKKEVHLVRINGLNVNIKMSVNGVVIFSENLEASVSIGAFQLNPFLVSGDNKVQITAKMIPTEYNNTSCNFVFGVVDLSVTNTISYDTTKVASSNLLNDKGVENFTYTIHADLPYTLPWLSGKTFTDSEATKNQLLEIYKEMRDVFVSRDAKKLSAFLAYQIEFVNANTYTSGKEAKDAEDQYISAFQSELGNPNLEPHLDTNTDEMVLELSEDKHLAKLNHVYEGISRPPVQWYDSSEGVTTTFPFWFMMTQDGKIVPILRIF